MQRRRDGLKTLINEARSVPCADCGGTFDPVCMDFHHVRGEKQFAITHYRLVTCPPGVTKVEQIKQEIAKCEVICANCHRLRHKGRVWRRKT